MSAVDSTTTVKVEESYPELRPGRARTVSDADAQLLLALHMEHHGMCWPLARC
jgi:hypothetical protein